MGPRIRNCLRNRYIGNTWWRHQMKKIRFTGPLWGESTGHRWIPLQRPVTRSFDVFFDLCLNKRFSKQSRRWWFETPSCSWWRHCNDIYSYDLTYTNHLKANILVRKPIRRAFSIMNDFVLSISPGRFCQQTHEMFPITRPWGYIYKDTQDHLTTITSHVFSDGTCRNMKSIPSKWIRRTSCGDIC